MRVIRLPIVLGKYHIGWISLVPGMGFLSNLPILGIQTLLNRTTCSIGRGGRGKWAFECMENLAHTSFITFLVGVLELCLADVEIPADLRLLLRLDETHASELPSKLHWCGQLELGLAHDVSILPVCEPSLLHDMHEPLPWVVCAASINPSIHSPTQWMPHLLLCQGDFKPFPYLCIIVKVLRKKFTDVALIYWLWAAQPQSTTWLFLSTSPKLPKVGCTSLKIYCAGRSWLVQCYRDEAQALNMLKLSLYL